MLLQAAFNGRPAVAAGAAAGRLPAVGFCAHPSAAPLVLDAATGNPPTTAPPLPPTPKWQFVG